MLLRSASAWDWRVMSVWAMSGAGYFWPGWLLIPVVWALVAHFRDRGKRGH